MIGLDNATELELAVALVEGATSDEVSIDSVPGSVFAVLTAGLPLHSALNIFIPSGSEFSASVPGSGT